MSDRHSVRKKWGFFIPNVWLVHFVRHKPLILNSIVLTKTSKAFGFNVIIFLKYVIFRAQLLMLSSIEKNVV